MLYSRGLRLFVASLIVLVAFLVSCGGTSETKEPPPQSPGTSEGSTSQTATSESGLILTSYGDLGIEGLMVYGSGNTYVKMKNTGNSPISTTGIVITLGNQEAIGHYLVVLKPGEDVNMSYAVHGDKFIIPEGLREVEVTLEILGCTGIISSLGDAEEEVLLEKTVTVMVP